MNDPFMSHCRCWYTGRRAAAQSASSCTSHRPHPREAAQGARCAVHLPIARAMRLASAGSLRSSYPKFGPTLIILKT
eukprot:4799940-Pleurochrysis_carterae.AAC.5